MTIIDGLTIFAFILLCYFGIIYYLHKKGLMEKYNISFFGPALMFRTKKGRKFLENLASHKRFWKGFGTVGVVFCFFSMFYMVYIFALNLSVIFSIDPALKELLPSPDMILVLPGINPLLPLEYLVYIVIALALAMIVHEFSHGILTLVAKIKVKSLGLLLFIFPIGAFCEPDEEGIKKTGHVKRMRIYAAGPMSNFVVTLIALLLFSFVFMPAAQPIDGAEILSAYEETSADEINMLPGALITSFNDSVITNREDLSEAIQNTHPNQTVSVTYRYMGEEITNSTSLTSYYDVLLSQYGATVFANESSENISKLKNTSFFGIMYNILKEEYMPSLKNPLYDFPNGFLNIYALPFIGYHQGYNPISEPYTYNYELQGPLSILPMDVFWAIASTLYWIFWLNLAVAIFNSLPIVPFDGGYMFSDGIHLFLKKFKKDLSDERREKIVKNIVTAISLLLFFLIIFPFFFKYL